MLSYLCTDFGVARDVPGRPTMATHHPSIDCTGLYRLYRACTDLYRFRDICEQIPMYRNMTRSGGPNAKSSGRLLIISLTLGQAPDQRISEPAFGI